MRTLFSRTLITIGVVSTAVLVFTLSVIGYFMLKPVGARSTHDLAALMQISAERWHELVGADRDRFAAELYDRYRIAVREPDGTLQHASRNLPYFVFLEQALGEMIGHPVTLGETRDGDHQWLWADLPDGRGAAVRVGFRRDRIGVQVTVALALVITVGALVTLATAIVLVRRLTAPIERLSDAARRLGTGEWPEPLPEAGPEELLLLTRCFNEMVVQVQELLTNRTTLLAGISHDLRTPLTRIQLALEMLRKDAEPALVDGIHRDVAQMNGLIGQFLEVSRGLEDSDPEMADVGSVITEMVEATRRGGADLIWHSNPPCRRHGHLLALRRVLANLLDNAVRYGNGAPVEVICRCSEEGVCIDILDRGPGIPDDQLDAVFRPFYRLETSRSAQTGGSGLGLAIARQLARANGWRILLRPRDGGGLHASLLLP
jgi:two-component system osmolarity sensor histidine kinase EnvZ